MVVDIILYGSLVYLATVVVWRFLNRGAAGSHAQPSRASALAGRVFGRGWLGPAVALVLALFILGVKTDLIPLNQLSEQERAELDHFVEAVNYYDEATDMYKRGKLWDDDWETVNALLQAALAEGEQVPLEVLAKLDSELAERFQEQFLSGLKAGTYGLRFYMHRGGKKTDTTEYTGSDSLEAGRSLLAEWGKWFNSNRDWIMRKIQ